RARPGHSVPAMERRRKAIRIVVGLAAAWMLVAQAAHGLEGSDKGPATQDVSPTPGVSGSRFVDEIDGRGEGRAKTRESAAGHHFAGARLTGLRTQREAHFLRQRAGRADQR